MTDRRKYKGIRLKGLDTCVEDVSANAMSSARLSRTRTRLFQTPILEIFTIISAPVFIGLWSVLLPAILVFAFLSAPSVWGVPLVVLGLTVWTATEYLLHRYVFHFETRSRLWKRIVFIIHGNHHDDPNDPLRNLMPPIVSLPVAALVWIGFVSVLGPGGIWSFFGFMVGYVLYDLTHYACHQWPMKGRLARMVKTHHMRHHHLRVDGNYAITGMIWDRIFSTRLPSRRHKN